MLENIANTVHSTKEDSALQIIYKVSRKLPKAVTLHNIINVEVIAIHLGKPEFCVRKKCAKPLFLSWSYCLRIFFLRHSFSPLLPSASPSIFSIDLLPQLVHFSLSLWYSWLNLTAFSTFYLVMQSNSYLVIIFLFTFMKNT